MDTGWIIRMLVIAVAIGIAIPAIAASMNRIRRNGGRFSLSLLFAVVAGVAIYCGVFVVLWHSLQPPEQSPISAPTSHDLP